MSAVDMSFEVLAALSTSEPVALAFIIKQASSLLLPHNTFATLPSFTVYIVRQFSSTIRDAERVTARTRRFKADISLYISALPPFRKVSIRIARHVTASTREQATCAQELPSDSKSGKRPSPTDRDEVQECFCR
jgi:hypothetical protein